VVDSRPQNSPIEHKSMNFLSFIERHAKFLTLKNFVGQKSDVDVIKQHIQFVHLLLVVVQLDFQCLQLGFAEAALSRGLPQRVEFGVVELRVFVGEDLVELVRGRGFGRTI
jgi:hypothetical protein